MISENTHAIADILTGARDGNLTSEQMNAISELQRQGEEARWLAYLDSLRARFPFKGFSPERQSQALFKLVKQGSSKGLASPKPIPHSSPGGSSCGGWNPVASLGTGSFGFGSAYTPKVTPAQNLYPQYAENTSIAETFAHLNQIAIGASMGNYFDVIFEPSQELFRLKGNMASASLSKMFWTPDLNSLAKGALMTNCSLTMTPSIGLVAGDPQSDPNDSFVYVCGSARLDVTTSTSALGRIPGDRQHASDTETLFIISGKGQHNSDVTNPLGGAWDTIEDNWGNTDFSQPFGLSATISVPPPGSVWVFVTVTVAVSAWSLPAPQSLACVDVTGQNTRLPVITVNDPYGGVRESSDYSRPVQVTNVTLCGI